MTSTHIVFLPGLMCDHAVWPVQQAGLADLASGQVIDYGDLDSLPAMAELVLAQSPHRFVLIAHSMGGRVAIEVTRQAPERVAALALLDTGYRPRLPGEAGEKEQAQRYALLDLARTQGMRVMGRQWLQGMIHPDRLNDAALVDAVLDMIERKTPDKFAAQIKALLDRPDAVPVLKSIRCPALVMCGREDRWAPLVQHQEIAALIPNSRLAVIDHSGHMSTMEQPEAVTTALRTWLTEALRQQT